MIFILGLLTGIALSVLICVIEGVMAIYGIKPTKVISRVSRAIVEPKGAILPRVDETAEFIDNTFGVKLDDTTYEG